MVGGPLHNIRSFLSTRPPMVVFIFCIGMMAVAFVSYAYYIKAHHIRNPNVQRDWNTFLQNITKLDFCSVNDSFLAEYKDIANHFSYNLEEASKQNVTVQLPLNIKLFAMAYANFSLSSFEVWVNGSYLGYSGFFANSSVKLNIVPMQDSFPECGGSDVCMVTVPTCVTITASTELLPLSPLPSTCIAPDNTSSILLKDKKLLTLSPDEDPSVLCPKINYKLVHEDEEKLFVMLTVDARSRAHVHLLHSSYFFFIVIFTILVFGIIRGGRHHHESASHGSHRLRTSSARPDSL